MHVWMYWGQKMGMRVWVKLLRERNRRLTPLVLIECWRVLLIEEHRLVLLKTLDVRMGIMVWLRGLLWSLW